MLTYILATLDDITWPWNSKLDKHWLSSNNFETQLLDATWYQMTLTLKNEKVLSQRWINRCQMFSKSNQFLRYSRSFGYKFYTLTVCWPQMIWSLKCILYMYAKHKGHLLTKKYIQDKLKFKATFTSWEKVPSLLHFSAIIHTHVHNSIYTVHICSVHTHTNMYYQAQPCYFH